MAALLLLALTLLISTGLHAYFNTFMLSLGAGSPAWTSPFFSGDQFGDFIKLGLAYVKAGGQPIHETSVTQYKPMLSDYLTSNPYSGDQALAESALTYFHLPPLYQIIAKLSGLAMTRFDPVLLYLTIVLLLVGWVLILTRTTLGEGKLWVLLSIIVVISYPSLFAIQRGNITAYLSSLLIMTSVAIAALNQSRWLYSAMVLALAVSIRPNYILLACYIPIVILQNLTLRKRLHATLISIAFSILTYVFLMLTASWIVPGYSHETFRRAYSYYVQAYEFGSAGINFCSSPFRLIAYVMQEQYQLDSSTFLNLLKMSMIVAGALVTAWGFWLGYTKNARPSKSLFIALLGSVISTPIFTDYHLLIFFAPILLSCLEMPVIPLTDISTKGFTALELITTGLLLSPKSIPILSLNHHPVTVQLLLNPFIILLYFSIYLKYSSSFDIFKPIQWAKVRRRKSK